MGRAQDRRGRAVRLRLTPLEDRTAPASGVVAAMSGTDLRVVDWMQGDTLAVHQTPSGVTLDATDTHLAYVGVGRVVLDVQSATVVTNDTSGLGTAPGRAVYMTRRTPSGSGLLFSGNLAPGATDPAPSATPPQTTTPPGSAGGSSASSGVVATLSNGELRAVDWRQADTLVVHQTATGVTLDAIATNLVYTGVTRVVLDVQSATVVTNDVSGLNGAAARTVYMTRRNASGPGFSFAGNLAPGATNPTPPVITPPPAAKDWFDLALNDAGLRSLARVVAGDGTIDRIDLLRLFAQVTQDGVVSANEFH